VRDCHKSIAMKFVQAIHYLTPQKLCFRIISALRAESSEDVSSGKDVACNELCKSQSFVPPPELTSDLRVTLFDLPGGINIGSAKYCVDWVFYLFFKARDLRREQRLDINVTDFVNDELKKLGYVFGPDETIDFLAESFQYRGVCRGCWARNSRRVRVTDRSARNLLKPFFIWRNGIPSDFGSDVDSDDDEVNMPSWLLCDCCAAIMFYAGRCQFCYKIHFEKTPDCIFSVDLRNAGCKECKEIFPPDVMRVVEDDYKGRGYGVYAYCLGCIDEEVRSRRVEDCIWSNIPVYPRADYYSRDETDEAFVHHAELAAMKNGTNGSTVGQDEEGKDTIVAVDEIPLFDLTLGMVHHIDDDGEVLSHREPQRVIITGVHQIDHGDNEVMSTNDSGSSGIIGGERNANDVNVVAGANDNNDGDNSSLESLFA